MNTVTYQPNYWHYLTGDFLNRVHPRFRKAIKILMAGLYKLFADTVLPTLTQRVTEMFNYSG